ncbi:hypothetical protein AS9A_2580 [Hoyosella subflava DQS3-9A1]|uniref:Uncharacterized protein n=1 Tax=Hoyosella subflava (strain DSM 45089 / JCM 17490 / NBRC 109087 / DQS3-9A1) TaxID=443218 RepID=F6EGH5_HOYSD|nr:hypothetical protein AS9A_2580 [Hoyosella subflava DQS3-9A1]
MIRTHRVHILAPASRAICEFVHTTDGYYRLTILGKGSHA